MNQEEIEGPKTDWTVGAAYLWAIAPWSPMKGVCVRIGSEHARFDPKQTRQLAAALLKALAASAG